MTPSIDFSAIRADFPRAEQKTWLAAAENHPYSTHTVDALNRYIRYRAYGPAEQNGPFTPDMQQKTKDHFAALINAKPTEIAFVQTTTDGENIVLAGLGLSQPGVQQKGNIVIDDLHYEASKYMYTALAKAGNIELRVVQHKNWQIDLADIEAVIDEETILVSVALVSQVNGYVADIKAISRLAHAHGAYVYADLIQGAGCTPIDVAAMGIDFAACNTYKWLMGDFGMGFLYVREGLHDVVKQSRYSLRQVSGVDDFAYEPKAGAARYEGSGISNLSGLCAYEGVKYLSAIGVDQIRAHVKPLTDRLQQEMPQLGYCPISPPDSPTPIVSFIPTDAEETRTRLDNAFGHQVVSFRTWYWTNDKGEREMVKGVRLGVSVYNNDDDIDKFLNALT